MREQNFPFQNRSGVRANRSGIRADAVVVGGGVVGKAAALGLAQAGLQVVLAGQGTTVAPAAAIDEWDLRVYALNHEARGLLTSLRVWDALVPARIAAVDGMVVDGDRPDDPGRVSFDAYSARVEALAWIVEDGNLNQALDAALRFAQGVSVLPGHACALQAGADDVLVRLDSGEEIRAPLVVGADGGNSWVRVHCDVDLDHRSYHQQAIVTNFACEKPHHGIAYQRFTGQDGILALLPLPGNRTSLVWSAPDSLAEALIAMPVESLARKVEAASAGRLGALSPLPPKKIRSFPLSLQRPRAMTAHRVALVGDAAHVVHPLAGQGMNLGLADVAALLRAVEARGPHRDCGDARVLGSYARSRKEDVLLMQMATDGLARLFDENAAGLRTVRNVGLNLVDRLPLLKRQFMARALGRPF